MNQLRVALADDEPLARARLGRLLREAGCEVLAELPTLPSGKLDRKRLPPLGHKRRRSNTRKRHPRRLRRKPPRPGHSRQRSVTVSAPTTVLASAGMT